MLVLTLTLCLQAVGLRGYGQKDPLIEYKLEGYNLFLEMMAQIRRNVIYSVYQVRVEKVLKGDSHVYQNVVSSVRAREDRFLQSVGKWEWGLMFVNWPCFVLNGSEVTDLFKRHAHDSEAVAVAHLRSKPLC